MMWWISIALAWLGRAGITRSSRSAHAATAAVPASRRERELRSLFFDVGRRLAGLTAPVVSFILWGLNGPPIR